MIFSFSRLSSGQSAASTPSQFQAAKATGLLRTCQYRQTNFDIAERHVCLYVWTIESGGEHKSNRWFRWIVFSQFFSQSAGPPSEARTVTSGTPACAWTDSKQHRPSEFFFQLFISVFFFPGLMLLSPGSDPTPPGWVPPLAVQRRPWESSFDFPIHGSIARWNFGGDSGNQASRSGPCVGYTLAAVCHLQPSSG